jgi:hypothetical protein
MGWNPKRWADDPLTIGSEFEALQIDPQSFEHVAKQDYVRRNVGFQQADLADERLRAGRAHYLSARYAKLERLRQKA